MIESKSFRNISDLVDYCNTCNIHKNNIINILFRPDQMFHYVLIFENLST